MNIEIKGKKTTVVACEKTANDFAFETGMWNIWWKNIEDNRRFDLYNGLENAFCLSGKHEDATVIVCGAGPSLKENIEYLRNADNAIVICVDRAFELLVSEGIIPDYCVTEDFSPTCSIFLNRAAYAPKTVFLVSLVSNPATINALRQSGKMPYLFGHKGECVFFWQCYENEHGFNYSNFKNGSVVTFTACDFAVMLGASTVITIGNELSVKKKDIAGEERFRAMPYTVHEIDGKPLDEPLKTHNEFLKACFVFGELPVEYPEVEFIDCSGGLKKPGWKISALKECIQWQQQ